MFLVRGIGDVQSPAQRDAASSSENLRGAEADAAQSIPAAVRNRNRLGGRSSEFQILPQNKRDALLLGSARASRGDAAKAARTTREALRFPGQEIAARDISVHDRR